MPGLLVGINKVANQQCCIFGRSRPTAVARRFSRAAFGKAASLNKLRDGVLVQPGISGPPVGGWNGCIKQQPERRKKIGKVYLLAYFYFLPEHGEIQI